MPVTNQIPILLLTGFLGSGKTTLLQNLLHHPQMADTAVIINELGEIGLDHHLVQGAIETVLVLENGCVCCNVRDDFVGVLNKLFWDRLHHKIPKFSRLILETTGVAKPGPIVNAIFADPLIAERFSLEGIVTTVDAVLADRQLDEYQEAVEQVRMADILLVTKTDLVAPPLADVLERRLHRLNSWAAREKVAQGQITPDRLFGLNKAAHERAVLRPALEAAHDHDHGLDHGNAHDHASAHEKPLQSFAVRLPREMSGEILMSALAGITSEFGHKLLRIKGIVGLAGGEGPSIVQVVGTTIFPLQAAPPNSDASQEPYLIFIADDIDPAKVCQSLERRSIALSRYSTGPLLADTRTN